MGKSTVSVNLAVALAEMGASVGLLDADVYGPSIPLMMGIHRMPEMDAGQRIIPLEAHGVKLMSLGFVLPDASTPVIWRGPMIAKTLNQFLRQVAWGELDYLLIDLPPGTGDAQLSLSQTLAMSGVVIVTTPQDVARTIASRVLVMFRNMKVPILGIVENMGTFVCPTCHHETPIFSQGGGRKASEELEVPFLGEIPLDGELCEGGDDGRPIVLRNPASPVAEVFRRVARNLAGRVSVEAVKSQEGFGRRSHRAVSGEALAAKGLLRPEPLHLRMRHAVGLTVGRTCKGQRSRILLGLFIPGLFGYTAARHADSPQFARTPRAQGARHGKAFRQGPG